MTIVPIPSLDLPALEPYRTLRENTRHWREGFFVCEGEKVVRRLLASGTDVVSMLLSQRWLDELGRQLSDPRFADTVAYLGSDALLDTITGFAMHKRLMAIGRIPSNPALQSLARPVTGTRIHVAVEGIADAENMGTIVRNCAAFGAESLVVGADSSTPYLRRSVRVSMGTIFSLRVHRCDSLVDALSVLRAKHGFRIIGTLPRGGGTVFPWRLGDDPPTDDMPDASQAHDHCIVFGSEGHGLSDAVKAVCDAFFTIPMHGDIDSLNVATATAVALHEATRNRNLRP